MRKAGIALTFAVAIGAAAIAIAQTSTARPIVYGSGGQPVLLDPGNITDGNSIVVIRQIYDYLVDFKDGTTDPVPGLATNWRSNANATSWTFTLRPGVRFHDGTPLNAEAVKFNLERWWDDKHPYAFRDQRPNAEFPVYFGGFKSDTANTLFKAVVVEGAMTIRIDLTAPIAHFPAMIGAGYWGIASPTAIRKAGAAYSTAAGGAVGTGPYVFKSWRTGDRIELAANPNYWKKGLPKNSGVVIRFITDPAARLAEVRSGGVDFTVDLSPSSLNEVRNDNRLDAIIKPSYNVGYVALNPAKKPLDNPAVRRAIAQAINKQEIVKAFWGELGISNGHFIPPGALSWAYSPKVTDYQFNPEAARKALADAGVRNLEIDFWYMPVSRPYFPNPKDIAEAMAADLAAVGIRANLKTKDWAAYLADRRTAPGFDAFMLGWTGDYGDPDNFYNTHFGPRSTNDLGNWKNERLLSLLEQASSTVQRARKATLYHEVADILFQEAVRIPIVHSRPLAAKRKNLEGWIPSPLGSESFANITLR
ncbi:MAG TPA: ABC transporter substrate-binding protein [Deinococcales bacterium]|nr:ABC transporter substrate-binding protein [Deinococcales bacterium]